MTNPTNFYALKREANKQIQRTIEYLQLNNTKQILLADLTIVFQKEYGFNEKILLKMLQPYIDTNQLICNGAILKCSPKCLSQTSTQTSYHL